MGKIVECLDPGFIGLVIDTIGALFGQLGIEELAIAVGGIMAADQAHVIAGRDQQGPDFANGCRISLPLFRQPQSQPLPPDRPVAEDLQILWPAFHGGIGQADEITVFPFPELPIPKRDIRGKVAEKSRLVAGTPFLPAIPGQPPKAGQGRQGESQTEGDFNGKWKMENGK